MKIQMHAYFAILMRGFINIVYTSEKQFAYMLRTGTTRHVTEYENKTNVSRAYDASTKSRCHTKPYVKKTRYS